MIDWWNSILSFCIQNYLYPHLSFQSYQLYLYNHNQLMIGFKFLLVLLFICFSFGQQYTGNFVGVGVVGPLSTAAFACIGQTELPIQSPDNLYSVIRIYQNSLSPSGIDPNAFQTINNAKTANFYSDFYIEICRGQDAVTQINTAYVFLGALIDYSPWIFIKVEPNHNPDCSWESHSHVDNCNFLQQALNKINQIGYIPGVFSTAHIWEKFFGSNCDSIAGLNGGTWLWYANYNSSGQVDSIRSFDDFVPFGGWTVGSSFLTMKQVGGNVTVPLCGSSTWHAFVDYIWGPTY